MATILKGKVIRETEIIYRGRPIVIMIEAPDNIRIKEKGRHKWFDINILTAYECAMRLSAKEAARKK